MADIQNLKDKIIQLCSEGEFEEAEQTFKEAKEEFKKEPEFLGEIIESEFLGKIIKTIQKELENHSKQHKIIRLFLLELYDLSKPDDTSLENKLGDTFLEWFKKAPQSARKSEILEIIMSIGYDYFSNNDYRKAFECFDEILKVQPGDTAAIVQAIASLRYGRCFDDASKKIEEISKSLPIRIKIVLQKQRGWWYFDQKRYQEAFKAFDDNVFNQLPKNTDDRINAIEGKIASLRLQRLLKNAEKRLNNLDPDISKQLAIQNELGRLYFDQKLYGKAVDTFRQLLEPSSDCPPWYKETAYEGIIASLRLQGKFDEAKKKADEALKERPTRNEAGIINQQGWIIFDVTQRFLDQAQKKFHEVAELASDTTKSLDDDEVKRKFDEAAKLASDVTKFLGGEARRKFDEAAEHAFDDIQTSFKKAIKKRFYQILVPYQFDKTAFYEDRRRFNKIAAEPAFYEAKRKFGEAAGESDKVAGAKYWPQPRFNQIHVLNRLNLEDKIEEIIEKLKKDFPSDLEVNEQIGWVYLLQNKIQKAETMFLEVLKKDKENIWGINGLGAVYLAQWEYEKAEESFRKILDCEPENPIFLNNLALTLVRQDEPNLDTAETKCHEALEQDADYTPVFLCLAVIAFKRGRYSESEYYLKKSIETGMRGSYTDLGALYAKMGRDDEAEEKLEKAIRTNPNDIQAHFELNNLRFKKARNNKTDKAREIINTRKLFKKAEKIDPNNGVPDKAYALVLMQSGKFNKAEKVLRDALQRLDASKRWQLHLTLSHLLLHCGKKIDNSKLPQWFCFMLSKLFKKGKTSRTYYEEALKEANEAKVLKPTHPDAYFYSGLIQYKLGEYKSASEDFEAYRKNTLEKSESYFEAKRYVNYIKPFIRPQEDTGSIKTSFIIAFIILIIEIVSFAWFLYTKKIEHTHFVSLITTVAIALLVAPFLPFLRRFRLPGGIEAEMKPLEAKPSEKHIIGPTGEPGFGSLLPTITSGGLGSRLNWPAPPEIQ